MTNSIQKKHLYQHLHRRIIIQLVFFVIITAILFTIVIVDALTNNLNLAWIVLGATMGVVLGYIASKAFKLSWHEDSQKIIMNIDRAGFLIIILYVLVRALTNSEAHMLFSGVELIAVTYSLIGGVMIGRLLGMRRHIKRILRENNII